ncbi:MAG: hypothetical protein Q6K99_04030 [Thermostichales cyanobacterium BF4_bins_65]
MASLNRYRVRCTLSYGDIYGQIIVWLIVLFAALASALSLMSNPIFALMTVALILVISLPFLLFAFVTTLFNHIEFTQVPEEEAQSDTKPVRVKMNLADPATP